MAGEQPGDQQADGDGHEVGKRIHPDATVSPVGYGPAGVDELHQKDDAQPDEETENEGRGQESRLPPRSGDLPQLRAQSAHSL